jgi:hypothetical protein
MYLSENVLKNLEFIQIILSKLQNQSTYGFFFFNKRMKFSIKGKNFSIFGRGILSNFDSELDLEKSMF